MNATGVGTNVHPNIFFNMPLRENLDIGEGNYLVSNLIPNFGSIRDFIELNDFGINFLAPLESNKDYFVLIYGFRSASGYSMEEPFLTRFTTAPTFSGYTVSGHVNTDECCDSPQYSFVLLATNNFIGTDEDPNFAYCAVADINGNFSIPDVAPGTYYPLAVKDVNNDGELDIDGGIDAIGFADSITVTNENVAVDINLFKAGSYSFEDAKALADSIAHNSQQLQGYSLKIVEGYDILENHYPSSWEFYYYNPTLNSGRSIWMNMFAHGIEEQNDNVDWLRNFASIDGIIDSAANLDTFLENVFDACDLSPILNARMEPYFKRDTKVVLGQLGRADFEDMVPDINGIYWGAVFAIRDTINNWWPVKIIRALGNYKTGQILSLDKVKKEEGPVPTNFVLKQNYPNPFNPTTTISYSIPSVIAKSGAVKQSVNVALDVYNSLGQKIATLVNKAQAPGNYSVQFDASNLPSGVYFYRLHAGSFLATKKMILLK
jgi:hypothetical protein